MEADTDFKPEQELVDFLKGGEAPIYIGYVPRGSALPRNTLT